MGGEEADKERREEELQALEAIYGDAFTLGELHNCHSLSAIPKPSGMSLNTLCRLCVIMRTAQVFGFTTKRLMEYISSETEHNMTLYSRYCTI